ncbi:MAG: ATP-dependent DNA helicase RecG, partial [Marinifilum sp.]|nr:ATP-dependent DNA helicase RecG [Marinifilum sp.]
MSELAGLDIKFLPGVGPKRASVLNQELSIYSYEDLLYHFPYKYIDRTKFYSIREINSKLPYIQVRGQITDIENLGEKRQQRLVAYFTDGEDTLELVWFKGIKYIKGNLKPNTEYIVFGKPSEFNRKINVVHPEIEEASKNNGKINASLQSFYLTTEKMKNSFLNSRAIQKLQENALKSVNGKIPETLPALLIKKLGLINLHEALLQIHFPQNTEILKKAQY